MEDAMTMTVDNTATTVAVDCVLGMYARRIPDNDAWEGINLSLAWRESGSVPSRRPEAWAVGQAELLEAFARYAHPVGYLPGRTSSLKPFEEASRGILRPWRLGPDSDRCFGPGWRDGDLVTHDITPAIAYAAWLDLQADDERPDHEVETFPSM